MAAERVEERGLQGAPGFPISWRALVAEFVGTFALIFIGAGSIVADHYTKGAVGVTGIALAHGVTIAVMVSAAGMISGGHFNPAVSIGALSAGKISPIETVAYVVVQVVGAAAAAGLLKAVAPSDAVSAVNLGTPAPGAGVSAAQAVVIEAVLAFFLMFVIYGTAIDARAPKVGGLFIGLTITVDILMGGPLTGAAMNPARFLGPAIVAGRLGNTWIYLVGPIAGALLAALLWRFVFEERPAGVRWLR